MVPVARALTIICILGILGCSKEPQSTQSSVLSIPVLEGCFDEIASRSKLLKSKGILDYRYRPFTDIIGTSSIPNLIGYIEYTPAGGRSVDDLQGYVNGALLSCYPVNKVDLGETDAIPHLKHQIDLGRRLGQGMFMLSLENGHVFLHMSARPESRTEIIFE